MTEERADQSGKVYCPACPRNLLTVDMSLLNGRDEPAAGAAADGDAEDEEDEETRAIAMSLGMDSEASAGGAPPVRRKTAAAPTGGVSYIAEEQRMLNRKGSSTPVKILSP